MRIRVSWLAVSLAALLGLVFYGAMTLADFQRKAEESAKSSFPDYFGTFSQWRREMANNQGRVAEAIREAEDNLDALTLRLGQMQAHVARLDALGSRLAEMAKLPEGEFMFGSPPALGGPVDPSSLKSIEVSDFISSLERVAEGLEEQDEELSAMETLFMGRNLQDEILPAGRPVRHGYISSGFGTRTDPITGRLAFHTGIDFPTASGSDVFAVASGVVTWSDKRHEYGNVVEINHGNGYVTRYAHNQKNLVKVGDKVERGQVIALVGSTGRTTTPHVHFEVMQNGKLINPEQFINSPNS